MTRGGDHDAPSTVPGAANARLRPDAGTPCPDDGELAAFVEHALPRARRLAIEDHVDRCEVCRAAIGHVAAVVEQGPQQIDRYRLDRLIGEGGMGVVWEAWDPALERPIAIKLVQPELADALGLERALREARALARLQHPNVVAVHDVGEYEHGVFIATELVDGESMDRWQRAHTPAEIIAAYAQAARGVAAAHELGLVHRDVKPSNIFVARDGRVRVGDFGVATIAAPSAPSATSLAGPAADARISDRTPQPRLTVDGEQVGTLAYMAPEQQTSPTVDARADQFSLCLALAEALLGKQPAPDADARELAASGVAAPWEAIARGLSKRADDRYADLAPLIAALEAAGAPAEARPTRRSRGPWIAAGGVALAAAAAAAAVIGLSSSRPEPMQPAMALRSPPRTPEPEPDAWTWTVVPPLVWRVNSDMTKLVIADRGHAIAASPTALESIDLETGAVSAPQTVLAAPAQLESLVHAGDRVLAFGRDGDTPAAWSITLSPLALHRLPFADPAPGPNLDELGASLMSPGGDQILVCITNRPPAIVDATTLAIVRAMPGYNCLTPLPFFTAPHRVVLGSKTAGVHEIDIATGALARLTPAMHATMAAPYRMSSPGGRYVLDEEYAQITIRATDGVAPARVVPMPPAASEYAVGDDITVALAGTSVIAVSLADGTPRHPIGGVGLTGQVAPDHGIVIARTDRVRAWNHGDVLATSEPTDAFAMGPGRDEITLKTAAGIVAWTRATGETRILRPFDAPTPIPVLERQGDTLVYEDGQTLYRSAGGAPPTPWLRFREDVFVQSIDVASNRVAIASPRGDVYEVIDVAARSVWALGDRPGAESLSCGAWFGLDLAPDHRIVVTTTNAFVEYDDRTHARLATFGFPVPVQPQLTAMRTTGEIALVMDDGTFVLWDPKTDAANGWPTSTTDRPTSIAFDADEREVAIGWADGRLTWARVADLRAHAKPVTVAHPADTCEGRTLPPVAFDSVVAQVY